MADEASFFLACLLVRLLLPSQMLTRLARSCFSPTPTPDTEGLSRAPPPAKAFLSCCDFANRSFAECCRPPAVAACGTCAGPSVPREVTILAELPLLVRPDGRAMLPERSPMHPENGSLIGPG